MDGCAGGWADDGGTAGGRGSVSVSTCVDVEMGVNRRAPLRPQIRSPLQTCLPVKMSVCLPVSAPVALGPAVSLAGGGKIGTGEVTLGFCGDTAGPLGSGP